MRIAVLMTCYDRVVKTLRALEALENAAMDFEHDIFLVDDASPDMTGAKVKETFPHVNVIKGTGKLYWAKGMRLAWEVAQKNADYDFFLWLNDDVFLKPDAWRIVLGDYSAVSGIPMHETPDFRAVIVGAFSEDEGETSCSYGVSDAKDRRLPPNGRPQQANGWLNGNLVLVPRSVFQKIGMISGEYSHARADYDYAERLKRDQIPFYGSSRYVGVCRNDFAERMRGIGLWRRIQLLWRPGHWNLHDLWLIRRRYHGVVAAILSCTHLVLIAVRGVK